MKALYVRGPGDFVVDEVPEPEVVPGAVLLKPLYSGICLTDKHAYDGLLGEPGPGVPPTIHTRSGVVGHEWSGEVVEVGEGVEGLAVGDRVVTNPITTCGECLGCRAGLRCATRPHLPLTGGFAELALAHESLCHPVPATVSDLHAALVEPLAIGTRAARLSGVSAGDNLVFLGAEDYGMSAFQWLRSLAGTVLVADSSPARRAMVERIGGATEVIDPAVTDPVARARELMPWGADAVFVGSEGYLPRSFDYLREAIEIARPQGTVVLARHQGSPEPVVPIVDIARPSVFSKELTLRGFGFLFGSEPAAGGRARGDYQRTIDGIAAGRICPPGWEPTVVPFADLTSKQDVDQIFRGLPDRHSKVLFRMAGR